MQLQQARLKINNFTVMFLLQYFCSHGILPLRAMYCVSFLSKSEAINVFPKYILKSKARGQPIQTKKKLFCHDVIVKNYLRNVLWKFLIKVESTWRHKIKEQSPQLTLLYRDRTVGSSHGRCCIRKLFLKTLFLETPV